MKLKDYIKSNKIQQHNSFARDIKNIKMIYINRSQFRGSSGRNQAKIIY